MIGIHAGLQRKWRIVPFVACVFALASDARSQVIDKRKALDAQNFWDNRDWDWFQATIPFFECPDPDITTTYYYRWELVTKHLTYGSPKTGYTFTEFIDRPFWSGAYGAISCPAGHQLYEVRWLRDPRYARDYARYWFRTPGAQPRRYSTWIADAAWATNQVHPDDAFLRDLLPDLVKNYEGWERDHYVPEVGLFWQTGHDDGMEYNINSRQTQDIVRGAPGFRPTLNAYLWADAKAIARAMRLAGNEVRAQEFDEKADTLKQNLQRLLWDPKREFFMHMSMRDEEREGAKVAARTLIYETGKYAGDSHGRELIGYVPWQFNLPDPGYESAWKLLMSPDHFQAKFGPTTVERRDPQFFVSKTCCWWSGQSWPYATSQTLKAMANLLQNYKQDVVSRDDYVSLLRTYAQTHRKDGKPYIAEAANPDTGSWEGHDAYNHSEHYFHSGFNDLVITGLAGLRPRDDETIEVIPLAPLDWDFFALDDVPYRGRRLAIVWDKNGTRYAFGKGLHLLVDGAKVATAATLGRLRATLPQDKDKPQDATRTRVNYAVNNDGHYYPRTSASFTHDATPIVKVNDGNYWYHTAPPNRWTTAGSPHLADWLALDFGAPRRIDTVRVYFLDDGNEIIPPAGYQIEHWSGSDWTPIAEQTRIPTAPAGRRANVVQFAPLDVQKLRILFTHARNARTGLSEIEAWGELDGGFNDPPAPTGNLAFNATGQGFPKASASYTSRYDKVSAANDGSASFSATPHNRWTAYESPNATDWLEIDFGGEKKCGRIELAIYDDRGGVQPPDEYRIDVWIGGKWNSIERLKKSPARPTGGQWNEAAFEPVSASKVRLVFTHKGRSRSGVSEVLIWPE